MEGDGDMIRNLLLQFVHEKFAFGLLILNFFVEDDR